MSERTNQDLPRWLRPALAGLVLVLGGLTAVFDGCPCPESPAHPTIVRIAALVLSETTSIGVRWTTWQRVVLPREEQTVETLYGAVRVKLARAPDGTTNVAPEFEDCRRLATARGVPLKIVHQAALAAALARR